MNDPRVAFWQPAKAAAKMQAASKKKNIILLKISEEGHFGQSSISEDLTDKYSFLLWQIGKPKSK
jgi:oligopeptidase B